MADKISVAEALDRIERNISPSVPQRILIDAEAEGLVLAAAVNAAAATPRFDCSAMDGFALASEGTRSATASEPACLALADDVPAEASPLALSAGAAAPISTGAPIPEGADAVVARESCRVAGGMLEVTEAVAAGRHIRRRGEDVPAGGHVAAAGTPLTPALIGALLAYGVSDVAVRRPPSIDIIATGSELTAYACNASLARIDSNGPMIAAMCRSLGLRYRLTGPVPDDLRQLCDRFLFPENTPRADMLISTGGVSGGGHDHVRQALEAIGARIIFHGVAMRPGKPILFALLPDGRPFFGLPGNPVAALVGFRFFVLTAIRRTLGLERERGTPVTGVGPARTGTTLFLRGRRDDLHGGVEIDADQRSHVLGSVVTSDCWVRLETDRGAPYALCFDQQPRLTSR